MGDGCPRDAASLWLQAAQQLGGGHWVANAHCQVESLDVPAGDTSASPLPVTLTNPRSTDASYVGNLHAAYVRYAQVEAHRALPRWSRPLAAPALAPLAGLIALAGLNRAALLDNWLLSTNLHPDWSDAQIQAITDQALATYPDRPIVMRSVCAGVNPALPAQLQALGYRLVPARTVYLCDPGQRETTRLYNVKQDQKCLADGAVQIVNPADIAPSELPRLRAGFRKLFLDKYSSLNPDYTDAFFDFCLRSGFLELHALRFEEEAVGVIGLLQRHGWATLPILGYDTQRPQSLGLYRRLMALTHRLARERGLRLHMSSGAGSFKRTRGGVAQLEYTAVLGRHLPKARQLALHAFATILQRAAPALLRAAETATKPAG